MNNYLPLKIISNKKGVKDKKEIKVKGTFFTFKTKAPSSSWKFYFHFIFTFSFLLQYIIVAAHTHTKSSFSFPPKHSRVQIQNSKLRNRHLWDHNHSLFLSLLFLSCEAFLSHYRHSPQFLTLSLSDSVEMNTCQFRLLNSFST